jgi:hypothetical protein
MPRASLLERGSRVAEQSQGALSKEAPWEEGGRGCSLVLLVPTKGFLWVGPSSTEKQRSLQEKCMSATRGWMGCMVQRVKEVCASC